MFNSRGLTLRTHEPFPGAEKAIREDDDIHSVSRYVYSAPHRILVRDTDEGKRKQDMIQDLLQLVRAYQSGVVREKL